MTRVTNLRFKRTYVEAGFDVAAPEPSVEPTSEASQSTSQPLKKKRKRSKSSKAATTTLNAEVHDADGGPSSAPPAKTAESQAIDASERTPRQKRRDREKREKERQKRALEARTNRSETRRLKRIADKAAATTCFACREQGHAARDCPVTRNVGNEASGKVVGICYRCGSPKHTLSRCKKPIDADNPMPFASCFVCSKTGHLASGCPLNQGKGVYPNGGCCKLCGETTHLAKDCGLRKEADVAGTIVSGVGEEAGADEDDFHTFKRRKAEVDREDKPEQRGVPRKAHPKNPQAAKPRQGAPTPKPKKVVNF